MHDMHLYLRCANSYVLFSGWRNVVRLHTVNQFFHRLVCIKKALGNRDSRKVSRKIFLGGSEWEEGGGGGDLYPTFACKNISKTS